METVLLSFFSCFGLILLYTLGAITLCGLVAHLVSRAYVRLAGGGKFGYVTAIIGTPIHELGHALMCLLFGHKITEMKLLLPPNHPSGNLGYVAHTYNKRNLWARLGNLFIGVGPIFSGLGVVILTLLLCFPEAWGGYLDATALPASELSFSVIPTAIGTLLVDLFGAFSSEQWWVPLIGIIIILFVSQHITLSMADVKGALSALPIYLLLVFLLTVILLLTGIEGVVLTALFHFFLRTLSLFAISITFTLLWLIPGLLLWLLRAIRRAF